MLGHICEQFYQVLAFLGFHIITRLKSGAFSFQKKEFSHYLNFMQLHFDLTPFLGKISPFQMGELLFNIFAKEFIVICY